MKLTCNLWFGYWKIKKDNLKSMLNWKSGKGWEDVIFCTRGEMEIRDPIFYHRELHPKYNTIEYIAEYSEKYCLKCNQKPD